MDKRYQQIIDLQKKPLQLIQYMENMICTSV